MFETTKLIIQLIPLILQLIKSVEETIPEGGKGKEKLEFVKNVLMTTYPQIVDLWGLVEKIVSAAVTLYNATGLFKK